jgi:hypothetical protein
MSASRPKRVSHGMERDYCGLCNRETWWSLWSTRAACPEYYKRCEGYRRRAARKGRTQKRGDRGN